jgi:hypothetical protein
VPQNRVYGFRIAATLRDKSVWNDANRLTGRHFLLLGVVLVLLELLLPSSVRNVVVTSIASIGLAAIVVADWAHRQPLRARAASRSSWTRTARTVRLRTSVVSERPKAHGQRPTVAGRDGRCLQRAADHSSGIGTGVGASPSAARLGAAREEDDEPIIRARRARGQAPTEAA